MANDFSNMVNFATLPRIPTEILQDHRLANFMYERIVDKIKKFEKTLPNDKQAGGRLINFGNITFSIDNLGYHNPDMLIFYGTLVDGSKVELLQHT